MKYYNISSIFVIQEIKRKRKAPSSWFPTHSVPSKPPVSDQIFCLRYPPKAKSKISNAAASTWASQSKGHRHRPGHVRLCTILFRLYHISSIPRTQSLEQNKNSRKYIYHSTKTFFILFKNI